MYIYIYIYITRDVLSLLLCYLSDTCYNFIKALPRCLEIRFGEQTARIESFTHLKLGHLKTLDDNLVYRIHEPEVGAKTLDFSSGKQIANYTGADLVVQFCRPGADPIVVELLKDNHELPVQLKCAASDATIRVRPLVSDASLLPDDESWGACDAIMLEPWRKPGDDRQAGILPVRGSSENHFLYCHAEWSEDSYGEDSFMTLEFR